MMMTALLQEAFRRFTGSFAVWQQQVQSNQSCSSLLTEAVEHVVDETYPRVRAVASYKRRLEGPVADTFLYVDDVVEDIPGSFLCSRSTFVVDPRVKAFFVSPHHLQEVFSQSKDVRELFDANPMAEQCCALVCMRKQERQKFGLALIGDTIQREVMQTEVSFGQHQVVSPGISEPDARRALKCCIFNSVLAFIRQRMVEAEVSAMERKKRLSMQRSQLRKGGQRDAAKAQKDDPSLEIENLENTPLQEEPRLVTLEERLGFVSDVLRTPRQFVSVSPQTLYLTHMGIKVEQGSKEPAYELDFMEVRIASKEPRVAALVRFPRNELLAKTELLREPDLFAPA